LDGAHLGANVRGEGARVCLRLPNLGIQACDDGLLLIEDRQLERCTRGDRGVAIGRTFEARPDGQRTDERRFLTMAAASDRACV
jgi:hypothetical protein